MDKHTINQLIIIYEVIIISLFVYLQYQIHDNINSLNKQSYEQMEMITAADKLRQSSDDLTHFARSYAVTTNEKFKNQYIKTLNIRNGKENRPKNYSSVYWDLPQDLRKKMNPDANKKSLEEIMDNLPYSEYERGLLKLSEDNSNTLVNLEVSAFELMKSKDKIKQQNAIDILHSAQYYKAKEKIMIPIADFLSNLTKRTKINIAKVEDTIDSLYYIFRFLLVIFIISNISIYRHIRKVNINEKGEKDKLIKNERRLTLAINDANKSLEEKIKKRTKQLELEKIKAEESAKIKTNFLANMSHEIRTPMNAIIGMTHLVLETELNNNQLNYIQKIQKNSKSLLGIINDILDFSKIESGKLILEKIQFDLFELIDNTIELIQINAHEKGLEVFVSYDENIEKLYFGDSLRIGQILLNFLSNAVKFTKNGFIELYISQSKNKKIKFEIHDSGIGLSSKQIDGLFKSFSQADSSTTRNYGGTGLGLSIAKQLIELMDGNISVQSELGVGSKFIFEIILDKSENNYAYNSFENRKILIVDDNKSWHRILKNTLEMFKIEVHHAYSGNEVITNIINKELKYDIILMDWSMPELDGIQTSNQLNLISNGNLELPVPIIMVSSFKQKDIEKQASEAGINVFLQKPINPSYLNKILSSIFLDGVDLKEIAGTKLTSYKEEVKNLRNSNILLVEDNKINQEIVLGILEHSGINIDIADNGQVAIDMYQKNISKYELILMDLQMPIMDGYEATKIIRGLNQNIPIIALTANAMKDDIQKTKKYNMNFHLTKPLDFEIFYKTLLKYIPIKDLTNKEIELEKENIIIPNFITIDKNIGLQHLMGNKKLYVQLLISFYNENINIKLEEMDNETLKREAHTIKGLSANLGAMQLSEIAKELELSLNKSLFHKFYIELSKIIKDIDIVVAQEKDKDNKNDKPIKIDIDIEKRNFLFSSLNDAIQSKQINKCTPIIKELEKYNLNKADYEMHLNLKNLLIKFDFKEALQIAKEIHKL